MSSDARSAGSDSLRESLEQADRDIAEGRTVSLDSLVPWWIRVMPDWLALWLAERVDR